MTPDERIGQLIWAFVTTMDEFAAAEHAGREGRIGGIWLLPTQMHSARETVALVNRAQAAASTPLLIGVDAEAGMGLVMGGGTHLPNAMALGAANNPALAEAAARVTAAEARACGINAIAAPVLDVNINPANPIINTRSFGASPEMVGRFGSAFLKALQNPVAGREDVLAIGKHFPGHGDTVEDSHLQLNILREPRERLDAVELPPFQAAIDAGVAMLMTAHVAYPALDPEPNRPATLSEPIMTSLLRHKMGFEGVAVTDCMNMHAIDHHYDPRQSHVQAVAAGCDMLLTHLSDLSFEAIKHAIWNGELGEERLVEASDRVLAAKRRIFGPDLRRPSNLDEQAAGRSVATAAHAAVADQIAAAATTLVHGTALAPGAKPLIVATRMARRFGQAVDSQLRAALETVGWHNAELLMVDPAPDATQVKAAVEEARSATWTALLHFNRVESFDPDAVAASDALGDLAAAIRDADVPLTVVSLGSPYVLSRFPTAAAAYCTFSACNASLTAVLRVLQGDAPAPGMLPVSLA
jgi:beta-N-acetylhexosaminidase